MQVGFLVKHWMFSNYGVGIVVEVPNLPISQYCKVEWVVGHQEWIRMDKLEVVCK